MAIPTNAPDPKLALEFINFVLNAYQGAELSNFNDYASPNQASASQLASNLQAELISPTPDDYKLLHFLPPLSGHQLQVFNAIWAAVKQ
ncbi:MAG: spermidine/putrescine ABC transporter substrate-binding protein, partial [Acidocella sp.]|nr:spermidine/putrescine ABC transporter substrate-binding protein [Acidocella sp.]